MTLEEVKEAFELWRITRIKRGPIPGSLWLMVQGLSPHYKKSQITTALRMSSAQFELGCQKHRASAKKTDGDFVIGYFSQPSSTVQKTYQPCELTLEGSRKCLKISMDTSQLAHALLLIEPYL